jgi:hypothetical protein
METHTEDKEGDETKLKYMDISTVKFLCGLMSAGGTLALLTMIVWRYPWTVPCLFYAWVQTRVLRNMTRVWKQTSLVTVLARMPQELSLRAEARDLHEVMTSELQRQVAIMDIMTRDPTYFCCSSVTIHQQVTEAANSGLDFPVWTPNTGGRINIKDYLGDPTQTVATCIFERPSPLDTCASVHPSLSRKRKPGMGHAPQMHTRNFAHKRCMATHVAWPNYMGEALGIFARTRSLPFRLYGTSAPVLDFRSTELDSKVERLKREIEGTMQTFFLYTHVVHLYGKFAGGIAAVLSALALSTIPDLDIVLHTEGCPPILSIEAHQVLQTRMRPSQRAGFLDSYMTTMPGEMVRTGLNSIRCFNTFVDKDCVPFMGSGSLVFHHTPYFLGCSRTRDDDTGNFFRNFAPCAHSGPIETLGRCLVLAGVWLQGVHTLTYTLLRPYRLKLYEAAWQRQLAASEFDKRDVMCLLECFVVPHNELQHVPDEDSNQDNELQL